jgi:general secretion pathway protein E
MGTAALIGIKTGRTVYRPVGCDDCGQTGFKGRTAVFEAVRIDSTIRQMINDGEDEAAMARHAFAKSPNLAAAARELVLAGVTTPEEAIRVSRTEDSAGEA